MPTFFSDRVNDAFDDVEKGGRTFQPVVLSLWGLDYGTSKMPGLDFWKCLSKCDNERLQLKKSKRITVRHFYSLVPMSVVLSPKATSKESSPGAPKVFR
ncbi:hypothetical protein B9Z45_09445 [Limnohabitans sp. 2KL-17]|uniref:hypothetical protein n=1 Tax=Limnohabitans sp. 2KL-17 TaxID=1100704 RepID=UPI000D34063A|nr:hypothetical protein [Limnohabitans sp. 2KL-17]PUE56839.1 hypothetical protein B9Z45_09445 [Limnohabitans sp. 2KL-17]